MTDLPMLAPVYTGKGKTALIAEAFAAAAASAPPAPRRHRLEKCRCKRCVHITREVCITLRALNWSYERIGAVVNRRHDVVQYHCKADWRAEKNKRSKTWLKQHPGYAPPSRQRIPQRAPDQKTWDNLGASNDAR